MDKKFTDQKHYVEYRLYVPVDCNQEMLAEMAEWFQEHIHNEWNANSENGIEVQDVTYEVIMEAKEN